MKNASVLRVAADLCFFDALFCLFSPIEPALWLLTVFLAAALLFGELAVRTERRRLRPALLLPPAALFFLAPDTATLAALIVCWLFFALLHALDRAGIEYWIYRRFFRGMAAIVILVSLYVGAALTLTVAAPLGVLLFAGLFLLFGFHTLRALRMGAAVDPAWTVWSLLELFVPCAVGGGLFILIGLLFRHAQSLFEILFFPVYALVYGFTWLMGLIFRGQDFDTSDVLLTDVAPMDQLDGSGGAPVATSPPSQTLNAIASQSIPWGKLLIAFLILFLLLLALVYVLRSRNANVSPGTDLHEERLRLRRSRKASVRAGSSAGRIRAAYRSYVTFLELHGRPVRVCDTSADVLATADPEAGCEAERELRELYLRARYGDADGLGEAEAARAETLLELISKPTE